MHYINIYLILISSTIADNLYLSSNMCKWW